MCESWIDNISRILQPSLTIAQEKEALGRKGAELLAQRIEDPEKGRQQWYFPSLIKGFNTTILDRFPQYTEGRDAVVKVAVSVIYRDGISTVSDGVRPWREESVLGIDIGVFNIRLAQVDQELKVLRSLQVRWRRPRAGELPGWGGAGVY